MSGRGRCEGVRTGSGARHGRCRTASIMSRRTVLSCLSRPVSRALLVGSCAIAGYTPRSADACGVPAPELTSTVPADGATYPGNAALLFSGFDLTLDAVTVTVDGQPASLVPAPLAEGFAAIAALVEPQPQAGQTVVVSGSFCSPEFCDPVSLTYTASAPDLTAPAPLAEQAYFGVYDHADFASGGGDCQSDSDLTFYLHVPQTAPAGGEALPVVRASYDPDGEGGAFGIRSTVYSPGDMATLVISATDEQLLGKDPATEVCITIEVVDTAGNAAPAFQVCPACYLRKDDTPQLGSTPSEPAWTEADAVPGSACAGATESTGAATDSGPEPTSGDTGEPPTTGEPETGTDSDTGGLDGDKGCACSMHGAPIDPGALVLFGLGLGLLRRRRSPVV